MPVGAIFRVTILLLVLDVDAVFPPLPPSFSLRRRPSRFRGPPSLLTASLRGRSVVPDNTFDDGFGLPQTILLVPSPRGRGGRRRGVRLRPPTPAAVLGVVDVRRRRDHPGAAHHARRPALIHFRSLHIFTSLPSSITECWTDRGFLMMHWPDISWPPPLAASCRVSHVYFHSRCLLPFFLPLL